MKNKIKIKRYEAYTDAMNRHFVYDNKLQCTFGRYKTKSAAIKEAKEMNECENIDNNN